MGSDLVARLGEGGCVMPVLTRIERAHIRAALERYIGERKTHEQRCEHAGQAQMAAGYARDVRQAEHALEKMQERQG